MPTDLSQRESTRSQSTSVSQEQRTQEAKDAFQASLKSTGAAIDNELQTRAKIIHGNAKELDKQDKKVKKEMKEFTKEGDTIEKFLAKSNKAMPNMDGFDDEIARLEAELYMFDDMLDDVEKRGEHEVDEDVSDHTDSSSKPAVDAPPATEAPKT